MRTTPILAVASGKGGVGKTLTAVNLALTAAREGRRTALIDADPLSNVMALLDRQPPSRPLPKVLRNPEAHTLIAAPRMEVIFPQSKTSPLATAKLLCSLLDDHGDWLKQKYSLVIIDLPAGTDVEGDFPYLDRADALMLVTNPEPTAHVAAGTLLRNLGSQWGKRPVYLWLNKHESVFNGNFNSEDPVGTYNRNVLEDQALRNPPPLAILARVPEDPSLNLVKTEPPVLLDLHRVLADNLSAIAEAALPPWPFPPSRTPAKSLTLIHYFLRNNAGLEDPKSTLDQLEIFLAGETSAQEKPVTLPAPLRKTLHQWLLQGEKIPLRRQALKTRALLDRCIETLENQERIFALQGQKTTDQEVDRAILELLKTAAALSPDSPAHRLAGLLLFRFSLLKLFRVEAASKLIYSCIPQRMEAGRRVRHRRAQIARLLVKDSAYQARYFSLVKKLYPVVSRQMDHLTRLFNFQGLLFRDEKGGIFREAYVKLFSAFLYEILNSGLGVVAGFRFRPASRAFKKGYDNLKKVLWKKTVEEAA